MRIGRYTKLGRVIQQPSENLRRLVNYSNWLETGEYITAVEVAILPVTATPFVIDNIVLGPDADRFAYYASGGEDGEDYVATFTITTSVGQTREDEILFGVREVQGG